MNNVLDNIPASVTKGIFKFLFHKLNKEKNSGNYSEVFKKRKASLRKHLEIQYPKLTPVVEKYEMGKYILTINNNLNTIVENILETETGFQDKDYKFYDSNTGVYLLVSVFLKTRQEVISYYEKISEEYGIGYLQFMTEHFLNNWPSNNLKYFLHLIICDLNGSLQVHTAAGDYGGSPRGKRTYMVFPTDIMNEKEKRLVFNH